MIYKSTVLAFRVTANSLHNQATDLAKKPPTHGQCHTEENAHPKLFSTKREYRFPGVSEAEEISLRSAMDALSPPERLITVSLDRVLTCLDSDSAAVQKQVDVSLDPGEELDASRHNYTITFPAGQLPPVNAFWSITMYEGKSQLLIRNPLDRYLINSPMLPAMKTNADGSLTLYLQKDSPGPEKESNWLPAPDGPMFLAMRLYWPKSDPPSILPPGEGTWAPPAIVRSH